MPESITIIDNRTGNQLEIPIELGGVSAAEWQKLLPGIWFYDPGFTATAACESAITFVDGDEGILRYRGYPIEQLAESSTYLEVAYLLLHSELPTEDPVRRLAPRGHVPHVHSRERPQAVLGGIPLRRPPDGDARVGGGRSVDLLPGRQGHLRPGVAKQADHSPHRQDADSRGGSSPVQCRDAVRLPGQLARLLLELPVDDVEGRRAALRGRRRSLARALDVLFILHADHEQNCSTTAMRVVGSSHADPYSACAAACAALYGPRHGGANEQVIRMLMEIGSMDEVPAFIDSVKSGKGGRLQGFGHRVYKSYDPRAKIIKRTADEVFEITGKNPLLDIALKLEEIALSDEYFTSRRLYPNVDFYSGLIYQAMGFPLAMFPVLFAIARTAGWLAHWQELLDQDSKLARPRQLYIGPEPRDYVPMDRRSGRRRVI